MFIGKTRTVKLTDIEITLPETIKDQQIVEMLGNGFLDQLRDRFNKTAMVVVKHERNTYHIA